MDIDYLHGWFSDLAALGSSVVIQVSGGVESTTILAAALQYLPKHKVFTITFDDDSAFYKTKDIVGNKNVLEHYDMMGQNWLCRIPQSDRLEFAEDAEYQNVGFSPGYKLFINTASMAYAHKVGASVVLIGNMGDNVYGDEKPENIALMQDAYNTTYSDRLTADIQILSPFMGCVKADVICFGLSLDNPVPYGRTLSCGDVNLSGGYHCGRCQWCKHRRKAFIDAGVYRDPTVYLFDN